jgi:beta-glucosidase
LGWDIYPEGFYQTLKAVAKRYPGKPVIVTENGIADANDSKRPDFMKDHLAEMARAMKDGVPVEGYCHWSLMDNFEWTSGFAPRFGLYEMDYSNFNRIPRPSAELYRQIIRDNGF